MGQKKLSKLDEPYVCGLNMNSKYIGFATTDLTGSPLYHKGKPVMGTRVFKEAQHADQARIPRSTRRVLQRRRGREREMERVFAPAIYPIDKDFFIRRRESNRVTADRSVAVDKGYLKLFASYPTLAHLDCDLMIKNEPADPRLIFEAITNHVVKRGHFNMPGDNVSSKNSDISTQVNQFVETVESYFTDFLNESISIDSTILMTITGDLTPRALQQLVLSAITPASEVSLKVAKAQDKALSDLVVGYKADVSSLVSGAAKLPKVSVSDSDAMADFIATDCPDELVPVLDTASSLYNAWKLKGLLSYTPGLTLSDNRVAQYDLYAEQLRILKDLALSYVAQSDGNGNVDEKGFKRYIDFFCGPKREDNKARYDKVLVKKYDGKKANMGYTAYNMNLIAYDEFAKRVSQLFENTAAVTDPTYISMMNDFSEGAFLRRIKSTDNAAIPYQLHAEVVERIIDNQGRFYPWLLDAKQHILKVLSSRIPYYVGPLSSKNSRFAWSVPLAGHETACITPWNYEDHIDLDMSAEKFIRNMTGKCAYLDTEDVLPKNSLLYERFCFLNELANITYTEDGDTWLPLTTQMRTAIEKAARDGKTMTVRRIELILEKSFSLMHPHVRGTSDPKAMSSKLTNYAFFCKLLDDVSLTMSDKSMAEDLILWNTVFEDRAILRAKIEREYGSILTSDTIDAFCRKRLTGWGKLSDKLLTGVWVDTAMGEMCIMDVLELGRPYGRTRGTSMNLMQILHDNRLGFNTEIERINAESLSSCLTLDDLPGSPALRRSVNQALKVIDDIVSVAGKAPDRLYVEVSRDATGLKKGNRTVKRIDTLKRLFSEIDPDLAKQLDIAKLKRELAKLDPKSLTDRVYLYFLQAGRDLYTGEPLDIDTIASSSFVVDHIVPRSYRKDDSLDNKALVRVSACRRKSETLLIDPSVQQKMAPLWRKLNRAALMSQRKLTALQRTEVSVGMLRSIVDRQLTEHSWELKLLRAMVEVRYPGTVVVAVKDGLVDSIRHRLNIPKSTRANRFYAAHDALMAVEMGRYIELKAPMYSHDRIRYEQIMSAVKKADRANYDNRASQLDFFVGGFFQPLIETQSGEVLWDSEMEANRLIKVCNYRNLTVTDAPLEDGGAYWKQTVYSPRDKSTLIPLKSDLPAETYGGYTTQTFSYFFIYEIETKRGKQFRFAGVPASIVHAEGSASRDLRLDMYARKLAAEERGDVKFVRIVRSRILKGTIVEINGERFRIAGLKNMYCSRPFALSLDQLDTVKNVEQIARGAFPTDRLTVEAAQSTVENFWDFLLDRVPQLYPKLANQLKLTDLMHPSKVFVKAPMDGIAASVKSVAETEVEILEQITGLRGMTDTKPLGGVSFGGSITASYDRILNDPATEVSFIDVSPAGLHEHRFTPTH